MNNKIIDIKTIKFDKEQILYLQESVKKLMDTGNYKLASIMARNISNYLDNNIKETKKIIKLKKWVN